MKDNRMKHVLENIAQRGVPEDINIWPQIVTEVERANFMQTVRTRPTLALAIVLLALTLLSGVAYAIGKVTGYIPGVGLVNQAIPVRILAKPIKAEQAGITVTVRQMVTDTDRTFLTYRVDGLSFASDGAIMCDAKPVLKLPDGSSLNFVSGGSGPIRGELTSSLRFETTIYYPPIPTGIDQVLFTFPCILAHGKGPENWQILLPLSPAPAGYVLSAVEVGATFVASTPQFVRTPTTTGTNSIPAGPGTPFPATPTSVPSGSGLYLEQAVELDGSYLLMGNFTDTGDLPGFLFSESAQQSIPYEFQVTDRNGNAVSFSFRPDLMPFSEWQNVTYWALEVRKPFDAPITITLPEVSTMLDYSFEFQIDAGTNPVPGQTWTLDRTVEIGGYPFKMESMTRTERGYTLMVRSPLPREKIFISLQLENHIAAQAYERFYDRDGYTEFSEALIFKDQPPAGILIFTLHASIENPIGPWTLIWAPPNK